MTELTTEKSCEDCDDHGDTHCRNCLSDHYGHAVASWHPACDNHSDPEQPEPPICRECSMECVEEEGDVCPDCKEKRPWKY